MLKLKTDEQKNLMFEIVDEENNLSKGDFSINLGGSKPETIQNNLYLVYNKNKFEIRQLKNIQKTLGLVKYVEKNIEDFQLDKTFLTYGIIYYQRDGKTPYLKKFPKKNIDELNQTFKNLGLDIQGEIENNYVKVVGTVAGFSEIKEKLLSIDDSNKAISFLLGAMIAYGKITTIESDGNISIKNILLELPFDANLFYEKEIIFHIENQLKEKGLYNKVFDNVLSVKFNLMDYQMIDIVINFIQENKLQDYFQIESSQLLNIKKDKLEKIQEQCKNFFESTKPDEIEIGNIDYKKIKSLPVQKIRSSF